MSEITLKANAGIESILKKYLGENASEPLIEKIIPEPRHLLIARIT